MDRRKLIDYALLGGAGLLAYRWMVKPALAVQGMAWVGIAGIDGTTRVLHDGTGVPLQTDGRMVYRSTASGLQPWAPVPVLQAAIHPDRAGDFGNRITKLSTAAAVAAQARREVVILERRLMLARDPATRKALQAPLAAARRAAAVLTKPQEISGGIGGNLGGVRIRYGIPYPSPDIDGLGGLGRFRMRSITRVFRPVTSVARKVVGTVVKVAPQVAITTATGGANIALRLAAPKVYKKVTANVKEYGVDYALVTGAVLATVATAGAAAPLIGTTGASLAQHKAAAMANAAAYKEQAEYDRAQAAEAAAVQADIDRQAQAQQVRDSSDTAPGADYGAADRDASTAEDDAQVASRASPYDFPDLDADGRIPGASADVSEAGAGDTGIQSEPDHGFQKAYGHDSEGYALDTENDAVQNYVEPGDETVGDQQQGEDADFEDDPAWGSEPDG